MQEEKSRQKEENAVTEGENKKIVINHCFYCYGTYTVVHCGRSRLTHTTPTNKLYVCNKCKTCRSQKKKKTCLMSNHPSPLLLVERDGNLAAFILIVGFVVFQCVWLLVSSH